MRLLLAFLALSSLWAQTPASPLIGRWRSVNVTAEGVGAIYEFNKEGVVAIRTGIISEINYRVEGKELILPAPNPNAPPVRQQISLPDKARMLLTQGQDATQLYRISPFPAGAPTIVGEWLTNKVFQGKQTEAKMIFYPTGKALFLMPLNLENCRYTISGNKLTIKLPNGKTIEGPFTVSGGTLTIPSVREGKSTRLTRF